MYSQGMRHGCSTKSINQSSSPWSGGTLHRQQRPNSSRPLQLRRSCAQCFGTEKAFCLWTSYLKAPQSVAVVCCNTLKKLRRSIQNKRRGMLSRAVVMIHDNTCPHTAMQNPITTFGWEQFDHPPTAQTYHQVIFISPCILNPSLLAGSSTNTMRSRKPLPRSLHSRRHHCMMKGSKNWCSAMTSASTMVETMSQTSVEYVH